MVKRIVAIVLIFLFVSIGWFVLGGTVMFRTDNQDGKIRGKVYDLWGQSQNQNAPTMDYYITKKVKTTVEENNSMVTKWQDVTETYSIPVNSSDIDVSFKLDYRKKGLLWYSTYKVHYFGKYTFINSSGTEKNFNLIFKFPSERAIYDNLELKVNQKIIGNIPVKNGSISFPVTIINGEKSAIDISYDSQGLDSWFYIFGTDVNQIKNFNLSMHTDFDKIDFPENTISPTQKIKNKKGWDLNWHYNNILTGAYIGMEMPKKLNPGPWVGKVTFFAPISLFLFFFLLFLITSIKNIKLHPMNYFFIGAAFFSFHLLMAYTVDTIPIVLSFIISSIISITLMVSYMRLVVGKRFAFIETGLSQFVYLVVFSCSFFFEGYTGLTITVLCIITLFVMMQLTGRVDWEKIFQKKP